MSALAGVTKLSSGFKYPAGIGALECPQQPQVAEPMYYRGPVLSVMNKLGL